jgi:hypothetical protein
LELKNTALVDSSKSSAVIKWELVECSKYTDKAVGWPPKNYCSISGSGKNLSLLKTNQTSSGAQPVSYLMGTRGIFPRHKQASM